MFFSHRLRYSSPISFVRQTQNLNNFRGQRNNLQELLLAQLAGNRPQDARAYRLTGLVDQHSRVLVEADVGSIAAAIFLAGAHNYSLHNLALLHRSIRRRLFYGGRNYIAQTSLLAGSATQGKDYLQLARA